jgi:hypothetical protein
MRFRRRGCSPFPQVGGGIEERASLDHTSPEKLPGDGQALPLVTEAADRLAQAIHDLIYVAERPAPGPRCVSTKR